jgi:hypothetical protein
MASPQSPDPREWRQMRNDVDDGYDLLKKVQESVTTIAATQQVHSTRIEEIQQTLVLHSEQFDRIEVLQGQQGERLDSIEELQEQILDLLRGRPTG